MAKTILGVDIGYDSLKLALVNGKNVRKTAVVPMPKNRCNHLKLISYFYLLFNWRKRKLYCSNILH